MVLSQMFFRLAAHEPFGYEGFGFFQKNAPYIFNSSVSTPVMLGVLSVMWIGTAVIAAVLMLAPHVFLPISKVATSAKEEALVGSNGEEALVKGAFRNCMKEKRNNGICGFFSYACWNEKENELTKNSGPELELSSSF